MTNSLATVEPTAKFSDLIELLNQQLNLYHQLGQLSLQQAQAIEEGSTEQLLSLLARRSQVIDAVSAINSDLRPFKSDWTRLQTMLTSAQRKRIGTLIQQIEALRDAIVRQDDADRGRLELAKCQISAELSQLADAGRALGAYSSRSKSTPSRYTDRQG